MGISAADARKLCEQAGAPLPAGIHEGSFEKVKNIRRKILDGISFRSTLEADVYQLLKSWERAGEIRQLVCQPKYVLNPGKRLESGKWQRPVTYIADFQFQRAMMSGKWRTFTIDAKGHRMEVYKIKAKLFRSLYTGCTFEEWDRDTLKRNGG